MPRFQLKNYASSTSFNGTSTFLAKTTPTGINTGTATRGVSGWVWLNDTAFNMGAVAQFKVTGAQSPYMLIGQSAGTYYYFADNVNANNSLTLTSAQFLANFCTKRWLWVYWDFTTTSISLYVNNVLVKTQAFGTAINTGTYDNLYFGNTYFFNGCMKDMRVHNGSMSATERTNEFHYGSVSSTVVSRYLMEERTGTSVADSVGSNTLTATSVSWDGNVPYRAREYADFDPSKLSSAILWLDVSRGLTFGATTAMATWTDQIGGYVFSQSTAGKRPAYTAQTAGGKALAAFNTASTKSMTTSMTAMSSIGAFTVCSVFKAAGVVTNQLAINADNNAPNLQVSASLIYSYLKTGQYGAFAFTDGNTHVITQVFDGSQSGNANRLKVYLDGVQQTLSFTGTLDATTAASQTLLTIGASTAEAVPYNGSLGDLVICTSALTDTQRQQLERYMSRKFKIGIL